ncbi:MAG: type IV pilus twitching motility protein PilT [Planctomycetota bacterium]
MFQFAVSARASDLLITPGSAPIVRIDGEMHPLATHRLTPADTKRLVWTLLDEAQIERFERDKELDFSVPGNRDVRLRANVYYQKSAVAAAFRLIARKIPTVEQLGLPPVVGGLAQKPWGLVLITGATGSGKSTTLAALVDLINKTQRRHIITVEDPIEYVHANKLSVVDQRELYTDTHSFKNALKYAMRQDPDVIQIGEMRDSETIAAALTAAETGHLVLATLHNNDAVQAIDRVIDVFPPHQQSQIRVQLSFVLVAIVAQQLIPKLNQAGRAVACEVLLKNYAIASQIREGKTHMTRTVIESNTREGMITMDRCLQNLYQAKTISYEEVVRRVSSPEALEHLHLTRPEPFCPPT